MTETEKVQCIKTVCEFILKRNIEGHENFYDTVLEALNELTSELEIKTSRCQCNCINFDEHEELEKEEQELITLRKLMKWEKW